MSRLRNYLWMVLVGLAFLPSITLAQVNRSNECRPIFLAGKNTGNCYQPPQQQPTQQQTMGQREETVFDRLKTIPKDNWALFKPWCEVNANVYPEYCAMALELIRDCRPSTQGLQFDPSMLPKIGVCKQLTLWDDNTRQEYIHFVFNGLFMIYGRDVPKQVGEVWANIKPTPPPSIYQQLKQLLGSPSISETSNEAIKKVAENAFEYLLEVLVSKAFSEKCGNNFSELLAASRGAAFETVSVFSNVAPIFIVAVDATNLNYCQYMEAVPNEKPIPGTPAYEKWQRKCNNKKVADFDVAAAQRKIDEIGNKFSCPTS